MKESSGSSAGPGPQLPLGTEEEALRAVVRKRVKEIVRKKKGGGGYVLYSPNQGKKRTPKPVGEFPTRSMAKQAELNRFPPKDPKKLKKARKEVERSRKRKRNESLERLADSLFEAAQDGLDDVEVDAEEPTDQTDPAVAPAPEPTAEPAAEVPPEPTTKQPNREDESRWEQLLSSLSKDALKRDSRLRSLHQRIENQSVKALEKVAKMLGREISYKVATGKNGLDRLGRPYITVTVQTDSGKVGPVYLYVRGDLLHVVSDGSVKAAITKLEPEAAKEIAEALRSLPEEFDGTRIRDAIDQRDGYLADIEADVDDYLSDLDALEMTILKRLLVDKYSGGTQ